MHIHTPTQVVAWWQIGEHWWQLNILTIIIYTHVKTIPFYFLYILAQSSVSTRWFRVENSLFFSLSNFFSRIQREIYILL